MKWLIAALLFLLLLALALYLAWDKQERIAFQPPRRPFPIPTDAIQLTYAADDGQPLFGFLVGELHETSAVVLAFHGNAVDAASRLGWAEELNSRSGLPVFLAEYRGYGGLSGLPSPTTVRLDARAALTALQSRQNLATDRIILYGHSIGSAVATELASEDSSVDLLILESPFTSARDMTRIGAAKVLGGVWSRYSRIRYNTLALVPALEIPVWVAHGQRDLLIPYSMGARVYEAAGNKGGLLPVPKAGHNNVAELGGEDYWRWITTAVASIRAPRLH